MYQFITPFRAFLCGPSMSGKTTLLMKIIQNRGEMLAAGDHQTTIKNIYYCYSVWQQSYDRIRTIEPQIKFIKGLDVVFNSIEPNSWLIIDDLAESIEQWSEEMIQLFTVRSHHEKISFTIVLHNLFHQSKCMRTLALNCTHYIVYKVVRDSSSLITLNKQIYPGQPKFLLSAYNQATSKPYGYIVIDLNQNTPEELRVISNIFDREITVYLPVSDRKRY